MALYYLNSRWIDEAAFDRHADLGDTVQLVTHVEKLIDHPFDVTSQLESASGTVLR